MIPSKSTRKVLLKSGRIIDPFSKKTFIGDILIENGKIAKIGEKIPSKGKDFNIVDCNGLIVTHGFVIFMLISENLEGKIKKP